MGKRPPSPFLGLGEKRQTLLKIRNTGRLQSWLKKELP